MKFLKSVALAFAGLVASSGAWAAFPDRPVSIIVPWAAGGGADTVTRIFAAGFEKELGVPVNVVNRPGGNGVVGHSAMATATADGYTLGAASPELAFYKALGTTDLSPASVDLLSRLAQIPAGITIKADAPYKTIEDLLKAIKESPKGTFTSSGTGVGGSWHIAVGGLLKAAGMPADQVRWIPSQGGAPALQDLVAGGVSLFSGSPIEAKSLLEAGRVRIILLMTEERSPAFDGVPTARERNLNWTYSNWFALVGPKGIPQDRRTVLFEAAKRAHARPEVQDALKQRGISPVWDAPGAFEAFIGGFQANGVAVLEDLGLAKK